MDIDFLIFCLSYTNIIIKSFLLLIRMSVNVFGSRLKTKSSFDTSINLKFITLVKNMQTKLDKSGDKMTGTLEMGENKISGLADPASDSDASNKKYVNSKIKADSVLTKLYIDTLLHTKLDTNDDEVCNKKYLDAKIQQESTSTKLYIENRFNVLDTYNKINAQNDDLTAENIFDIGSVINNLLKEKDIRAEQFSKGFHCVENLYEKYIEIFEIVDDERSTIPDILKSYVYDLKVAIVKVIEDLPRNIFMELKVKLMRENLLSTSEVKTLQKRYRRFINGASKIIDPQRTNETLELLIQKNLLLIDLGYAYFTESLLERLLAGP